ncbi:uncharacterized protein LOC142363179 [Opisthocomus hoazin]|uniref:uncharacterized protein LOC142363179 n=1 Tax=Opisthocomus hoazin TaxID=30419 RepID=UPI003F52B1DC
MARGAALGLCEMPAAFRGPCGQRSRPFSPLSSYRLRSVRSFCASSRAASRPRCREPAAACPGPGAPAAARPASLPGAWPGPCARPPPPPRGEEPTGCRLPAAAPAPAASEAGPAGRAGGAEAGRARAALSRTGAGACSALRAAPGRGWGLHSPLGRGLLPPAGPLQARPEPAPGKGLGQNPAAIPVASALGPLQHPQQRCRCGDFRGRGCPIGEGARGHVLSSPGAGFQQEVLGQVGKLQEQCTRLQEAAEWGDTEDTQKADQAVLETKVSQEELQRAVVQLSEMMKDLLQRMSLLDRDRQKALEKILSEMDPKLDRVVLAPLQTQPEQGWRLTQQCLCQGPCCGANHTTGFKRRGLLGPIPSHPIPPCPLLSPSPSNPCPSHPDPCPWGAGHPWDLAQSLGCQWGAEQPPQCCRHLFDPVKHVSCNRSLAVAPAP